MRVGFIGLGLMGKPMCRRLLGAGFELYVHNRSRPAVELLAAEGARACRSSREVAERAEATITMLPGAPEVEEAALGDGGILEGARPGSLYIDMTSNDPACVERVAQALGARGVATLDAPVSGAPEGAEAGTLSIMAGGPREAFERAFPLFQAMGRTIVHVGERPGAGCYAKIANQILVGITFQGVAEALLFSARAGLELWDLVRALSGGLARCGALEVKAPKALAGDFAPGAKVVTHIKDLTYALEHARKFGLPLPATAMVQQLFLSVAASGGEGWDHISIITALEKLAGLEARARPPEGSR
ncbi:MAG: NAD(P)-dependent oxidoreductase [Nitrospinota bacterium]